MSRRLTILCSVLLLLVVGTAAAQPSSRSWAAPQIAAVVGAGLMASSVDEFRPDDPLTLGELAVVLGALGAAEVNALEPDRLVTIRELNARLVTVAGLRSEAQRIRRAARAAGLTPTAWLGTETVARLLGLRTNHDRANEHLERQLAQPATRAEAAYSIARLLALRDWELDAVREAVASFELPALDDARLALVGRALRLVGSPYVWGGVSERSQRLDGRVVPGGFDCSGLVWRVFKAQPLPLAPGIQDVLRGRTSYAMSGEVPRAARVPRAALQPADVVFFGSRGPRSKPTQVGHMGIYLGNGWMLHSSRNGTTLQPMTGWYQTSFAWGRNLLAEAGAGDGATSRARTRAAQG